MTELNIPETRLDVMQKVSDIYDIFDPAVDYIIKEALELEPAFSRRDWEQAMIFLALHKAGKINSNSQGLGLGVGVERLIFALSKYNKKIIATDLFHSDEGWESVRTRKDPLSHVMDHAPWEVKNLEAAHMDMRDIKFDDYTFDFAWSTGSFEHIGVDKDFLKHLEEVHRVLKPGGVYAFTTAINYRKDTQAIIGNHIFHPDHLMKLVHKSPLVPDDTFDCGVRSHYLNRPMPVRPEDYGLLVGRELIHPYIGFTRGIIHAANLVVLTKDDTAKKKSKRPRVVNFTNTTARLNDLLEEFTEKLWSNRQQLNVEKARKDSSNIIQWQYFGQRKIRIEIGFVGKSSQKAVASLRKRSIKYPVTGEAVSKVSVNNKNKIFFDFKSKKDSLYRIKINSGTDIHDIVVKAYSRK